MSNMNNNQSTQDFQQENVVDKPKLTSEVHISAPQKAGKQTKKSKDAFRTISEVADKLDVQQHVLRFWETKFSQVRPLKRGGGRRYYRPEDVALITRIHHLLYTEGYTIKGVQKLLKEQGKAQMVATQIKANETGVQPKMRAKFQTQPEATPAEPKASISDKQRAVLEIMLTELKAMRAMINV